MSDTVNPYQSPETAAVPLRAPEVQGALTETMLIYLKGASPWLRFIGILGFIGSGFVALWGVFYMAAGSFMTEMWNDVPGFELLSSGIGGVVAGAFITGASLLVFFPSLFVYRFGERIRSYLRTGAEAELEAAFKNNKSLWKFYGIICVIYLAFIPVMIILGVIIGFAGAFSP